VRHHNLVTRKFLFLLTLCSVTIVGGVDYALASPTDQQFWGEHIPILLLSFGMMYSVLLSMAVLWGKSMKRIYEDAHRVHTDQIADIRVVLAEQAVVVADLAKVVNVGLKELTGDVLVLKVEHKHNHANGKAVGGCQ
jgi:hypothetical protein